MKLAGKAAVRKALALKEANLTAHLPMAACRAAWKGWNVVGKDYGAPSN